MMPPKACYIVIHTSSVHASLSSEKEEMSAETVLQILLILHVLFQMVPTKWLANSWPVSQDLGIALVPLAQQHMPKLSVIG